MASKRSLDSSQGEPKRRYYQVVEKKVPVPHWSQGLKTSMEDPDLIVESDDEIVIIRDKFPKAQHHYLILPKENILDLKALKIEHLPLLKHMDEKAEELVANSGSFYTFQIGYHAVPSMSHLHLHVISQDFNSPCLKTKVHWNSFTTEYFMESKSIIEQLETTGKIKTMDAATAKEMFNRPLRCHVCKLIFPNMPKLKSHIAICL